jgi:hypothetical protein
MDRDEAIAYIKSRSPMELEFAMSKLDKVKYQAVINAMEWSFSRVNAWHDCNYSWMHTYLYNDRGVQNAWSQMGTHSHESLEPLYRKEIERPAMAAKWLAEFDQVVSLSFPFPAMRPAYRKKIGAYFTMVNVPEHVIGIETEFKYLLPNGKVFKGFIDLIAWKPESGPIVIDHKVSKLFSGEDLFKKRRQIHTYFLAIPLLFNQQAGAGYFHFLQTGDLVKVENKPEDVNQTVEWITDTIGSILQAESFPPILDLMDQEDRKKKLFFCQNICSHYDKCPALEKILGHKPTRK